MVVARRSDPTDPRLATAPHIAILALGAATAFVGYFVVDIIVGEPMLTVASEALGGAGLLGAWALLRRRDLQPRHVYLAGLSVVLLIGLAAFAVLAVAEDAYKPAYIGIYAALGGFCFLSWRWFAASQGLVLILILALMSVNAMPLDRDAFILVIAGSLLGAVILASRLRAFRDSVTHIERSRAAEQRASAATAQTRAVFEWSPFGLLVVEPSTGLIMDANRRAAELTGHATSALIGTSPANLLLPSERRAHGAAVADLVAGRRAELKEERRVLNAKGEERRALLRIAPVRDERGALVSLVSVLEDVTEARARERQLELQARMLASVGQAVMVTDPAGRITYWNKAAERLYGWRTDEVLGRNIVDVTPSKATREQAEAILAALRTGASWSGEFLVQKRDGTEFLARVADSPILDETGRLVGIIGISDDITAQKQTEEALRRSERDAALGTLVMGVAHEINNPLQFMVGNVDLAEMDIESLADRIGASPEDAATLEEIRRELAALRRGLDHITHITRSLRLVARRSEGAREPVDVNALAESVLTTAAPRFGPDVEVQRALDARRLPRGNASELAQVLLNLVLNAAEAVKGRGRIAVRAYDQDDAVVLEVEDDGPGIPPEAQERIFVPFFTTKAQGTGLGLAISRRIVQDHGGTLTFTSEPGRTVFRARIPAQRVAPVQA